VNPEPLTPHGPGFSFVDRMEIDLPAQQVRAWKRLDPGMEFFRHHFPGRPLMPAVLLAEVAAQSAGCLWGAMLGLSTQEPFVLARIDRFKVARAVGPGDELATEVTLVRSLGTVAEFEARIQAGGVLVAGGAVTLARLPGGADHSGIGS
jgi:3-hydroxyacyl-[acyl-carrier-protein] dehydratase